VKHSFLQIQLKGLMLPEVPPTCHVAAACPNTAVRIVPAGLRLALALKSLHLTSDEFSGLISLLAVPAAWLEQWCW
jgi:hypothetical protein